jgi:hypothetical protein
MDFKIVRKGFYLAFLALFVGVFSGKAFLLHKKKRQLDVVYEIFNKPIHIIVFSDDEKVLKSAISQDYDNFKIYYLKKNSSNNILAKNLQTIELPENFSKQKSIFEVLTKLPPDDIVIIIDDQYWFAHDHVLSKINHTYNQKKFSALLCSEISYPKYELLKQSEIVTDVRCFLVNTYKKTFQKENIAQINDVLFITVKGDN